MPMLDSAALVAHTGKLDLVIRHVLAGLGQGIHVGRERGAGVEFSEYRAYAPGDWKLAARADRYFVREAERDSHVAVWLVLDATASMIEPSRSIEGLTKLHYARVLLACVAALAQQQGDAFGLVVCNGERAHFTPAARGPRQLQRVLARLNETEAGGRLPGGDALRASLHFGQAPSVVCVASDFLDWPSALSASMLRLRAMRHDVRALCLHTAAEIDASFDPSFAYRDPERDLDNTGAVFRFGRDVRDAYARARGSHFDTVLRDCRRHDVPLVQARIEQAPGEVLRAWMRRHMAGARAA
jgi:uncharacterized protein (DUF58 family)